MNWFMQHIPNFVEADKPQKIPFETTEELLNLEIVKRYGQQPDFSHFALSGNLLMEISNGGLSWWVIGYIGDPTTVNLPQWDGGKYTARLKNGSIVELAGKDVCSSCGDILTLSDGTTAKNLRW